MADSQIPRIIQGTNLDDTWLRMVEVIRSTNTGTIDNLIVHVKEPTRCLPESMRKHEKEISSWATELQSVKPQRMPFTHGQRILNWAKGQKKAPLGGRLDQIRDFVVPMLMRNPRTKRAMVMVTDPTLDGGMTDDPIPALVLIQFRLDQQRLNVTSYFRAQEMYFFWLVNMFELISLQEIVCKQMQQLSHERLAKPGSITTFAFTGYINPIDLERVEATDSTTLAIERFGISQLDSRYLENLLKSALIEANSVYIDRLLDILDADRKKLDRVRDINYKGLELWQVFLEANEQSLHPQFRDLPRVLRSTLFELVSLDMDLEREEHVDELRKKIESADKAMQHLMDALQSSKE